METKLGENLKLLLYILYPAGYKSNPAWKSLRLLILIKKFLT